MAGMGEIEILAFYATFSLLKWRENSILIFFKSYCFVNFLLLKSEIPQIVRAEWL